MIDKSVSTKADYIFIEFGLIENLELVTTDDPEVDVFSENDFGGSSNFILEEKKGIVYIKGVTNTVNVEASVDKECAVQPVYPSYKIRIPKHKKVDIIIREGNFFARDLKSDVNLKLEKGIVNVDSFTGKLMITINIGNVYCKVQNTIIDVYTNMGFVRSDIALKKLVKTEKQMKGTLNIPVNELKIKALKANLYIEELPN